MTEQQPIGEIIMNLEIKARRYKQVLFGIISPKELGENALIIQGDNPVSQDEKRQAKINELDLYKKAYLESYFKICELTGEKVSLKYLMDNAFGIPAGDLFDDESLDELIQRDEQIDVNQKDE